MDLKAQLGDMDIYLLDQLLKGRITKEMRILDAGCGSGRNLVYFMRNGYDIYAVDRSEEAIRAVRSMGDKLSPELLTSDYARVESVEKMSFTNESFEFVICNAVLHFAENQLHFHKMVNELWRVLKPGGMLFVRTASLIGIENKVTALGQMKYLLPDGSVRFLVDEAMITRTTEALGGTLFEPLKTVHVAGQRCMSIWCVRKSGQLEQVDNLKDEYKTNWDNK